MRSWLFSTWQASAHLRQPTQILRFERIAELGAGDRLRIVDRDVRRRIVPWCRLRGGGRLSPSHLQVQLFVVLSVGSRRPTGLFAQSVSGAMALAKAAAPSVAPSALTAVRRLTPGLSGLESDIGKGFSVSGASVRVLSRRRGPAGLAGRRGRADRGRRCRCCAHVGRGTDPSSQSCRRASRARSRGVVGPWHCAQSRFVSEKGMLVPSARCRLS